MFYQKLNVSKIIMSNKTVARRTKLHVGIILILKALRLADVQFLKFSLYLIKKQRF